jgi:hypothetical protein
MILASLEPGRAYHVVDTTADELSATLGLIAQHGDDLIR